MQPLIRAGADATWSSSEASSIDPHEGIAPAVGDRAGAVVDAAARAVTNLREALGERYKSLLEYGNYTSRPRNALQAGEHDSRILTELKWGAEVGDGAEVGT
jgi:hypothetical protein